MISAQSPPQDPDNDYCAVGYQVQGRYDAPSIDQIILIATISKDRSQMQIYVYPAWMDRVGPEDHEYVRSIIGEIPEWANSDPEALFKQFCSLSVGPLITAQVGSDLLHNSLLRSLQESFITLID